MQPIMQQTMQPIMQQTMQPIMQHGSLGPNPLNSKLMVGVMGQTRAAAVIPPAAPRAPQAPKVGSFTFGSIVGTTNNFAQQQPAAGVNDHTKKTMQRLAELQKLGAIQTSSQPLHTPSHAQPAFNPLAAQQQRFLKAGYVNGGSVKTESTSEIMRLTALVDTLNSKIVATSERLQKTESSLLKANQSITTERAASNARIMKIQSDLKASKETESNLRKHVVSIEASVAQKANKKSFEDAAKEAELFDSKITKYEQQINDLTKERDAFVEELSSTRARAEEALNSLESERLAFAQQLKAEKDAVATTSANADTKMLEFQSRMNQVEAERDALSKQLEDNRAGTEAQIEELKLQHERAVEEKAAASEVNVDAIIAARNRFESDLELCTHEMAEAKSALKALQDEREAERMRLSLFEEPATGDLAESEPNSEAGFGEVDVGKPCFEYEHSCATPNQPSCCSIKGEMDRRVVVTTALLSEMHASDVPLSRAVPAFVHGSGHHANVTTATDAAMVKLENKVANLVKVVSSDITNAITNERKKTLFASGKTQAQVDEEIRQLFEG